MDLKEAEILGGQEERHWYYASKARALRRALERQPFSRIIDVGAGSGFFSRMLLRQTTAQSATCVDPGYTREWSEAENGKPIEFRRDAEPGAADLVLMMDVLEHVDDDVALVRQYTDRARPGTRVLASVPAFSWLWSAHDVFLEHRRRYTLPELTRVLAEAGLVNIEGFYFFASVLPAVAAIRLLSRGGEARPRGSDLRRHGALINSVLTAVCRLESVVTRHNHLCGLTAFALAETPDGR